MKKVLNWQLILCAFAGGVVLSIMELATMFKAKEKPDLFFFGGLLIAGAIGIIGYAIARAPTYMTAFMSGISSPQLLGGVVKAGSASSTALSYTSGTQIFSWITKTGIAVTQAISLTLLPTAYAEPVNKDSVKIVAIVQGIDSAKIQVKNKIYKISDITKLTIKRTDSITIFGDGFSKNFVLGKKVKDIVVKIQVTEEAIKQNTQQQEQKVFEGKYRSLMRGMFAKEQKQEEPEVPKTNKKIEITIE